MNRRWQVVPVAIFLAAAGLLLGCGEDDPVVPTQNSGITSYDQVQSWSCATSEDCQDVFDITLAAGTQLTVSATETTGGSVCQIALYAPGVALGGTNLFTGTTAELRCNFVSGCSNNVDGQTVTDFDIATAGKYRLAITRDWGNSCGGTGNYRLQINTDKTFTGLTQTVDDEQSLANGNVCPTQLYDEVKDWVCATSESCQDVFDIFFQAGSVVDFSATETTGGSVLQVALYAPGVALGETNLFTGTTNEFRCNFVSGCSNNTAGQTVSDFVIPSTGVYRFAVTRDWGNSCGGSGTYRLIVSSNMSFSGVTQTVDDVQSLAPDSECP